MSEWGDRFMHLDSTRDGHTSHAEIAAGFDRLEALPGGPAKLKQIRLAMASKEAAIAEEAHSAKQVDGLKTAAIVVGAGMALTAVVVVTTPVVGILALPMLGLGLLAFIGIFAAGMITTGANQRDNDDIAQAQRRIEETTLKAVVAAPEKPKVPMIPALQTPTGTSGASLR